MNKLRYWGIVYCYVLLCTMLGCTGKTQISGTVTYPDSQPVYPGKVCFSTEKETFFGRLDKNGHYAIGEFKDGEGIKPGKYNVWLAETGTSEEILRNGKPTGHERDIEFVDAKYTSPNPDGLTFELKRGWAKTFDFTVERYEQNKPLKEKQ